VRVLLVTPYYLPAYHFGGPVVVAETVVGDLLARGHEVTVATTDALDDRRRIPAGTPAERDRAVVRRFPNIHHGLAARSMAWTPRGWRRWIASHAREFDVVLLYDVYSVLSVAAARAAVAANVPYVVQPLGSLAPSRERGRPLVKRAFLSLWGRRTLREAAALVHSTDDERQDFLAVGSPPDRLVRLPLPLDLPAAQDTPTASAPTVVSVGRLDPIKGLDVLIEAVALARREVPRLRLEIAGPGDDHRAQLAELAARLGVQDAVRFHGFVSTAEKVRLLEGAHAFCLLSRSEGLPVSALEAMACGTPVVLSRGCHLPEVDGVAGAVVDRDPAAAATAIAGLLADEPRRREMGRAARAFAEDFRTERAMGELVALLERLTGTRHDNGAGTLAGRRAADVSPTPRAESET
jgi:glycosyltransferase involved in cell wall biosynthesis